VRRSHPTIILAQGATCWPATGAGIRRIAPAGCPRSTRRANVRFSNRDGDVSCANEIRGAKRGANDGRHQAAPSAVQRLSSQVDGTSSHVQRHPAT
jgi:hypothetical protein